MDAGIWFLAAAYIVVWLLLAVPAIPHGHNHCGICGARRRTLDELSAHMREAHRKEAS